jgi:TonB-linked SusC/RagA family outer membrane protein
MANFFNQQIMRRFALFSCSIVLLCIQLQAQNRIIAGKVLDEKGNPIPLASVSVKGVRSGVTTAEDGSFQIPVNSPNTRLIISSIGYLPQEVNPGSSDRISIILKLNPGDEAEDAIVTGYARIKRPEYAGAASIVQKESINDIPLATFDQILQGQVPGLLVSTGSGQPGQEGNTKVQIRGQGSISGSSDPLYVLDGMPIEAENFRSLNPADFENIQVLRDAVAAAQYGNRGSSGVIVITTKKGRAGRSVFSYSGQAGITQAGKQYFDMANSAQILQIQEAVGLQSSGGVDLPGWVYSSKNPANAGLNPTMRAQYDQTLDSLRHINTDWRGVFERQGSFIRHDLSLSGGTDATRFYLGGGFYKEQGIGLNSDLTRYTFRANLDHKSNKFTLGLSSGFGYSRSDYINSQNQLARANEFGAIYLALPYQKLFNPDGSVAVGPGHTGPNAYDLQVNSSSLKDGQIKADLMLRASYDISRDIYVGGAVGLDYRQTTSTSSIYPNTYFANTSLPPIGPIGNDTIGHGDYGTGVDNYFEYIARALLGFKKVFDGRHDVDLQVITEYTKDHQDGFSYTGYGINPNLLNTPAGITQGTPSNGLIPVTGGNKQERALNAAMLLGKYSYMEKYTLNFSFRRDGTSQLAPQKRFQNFYSAGLTWNVLKEDFARNWNLIDHLRMRLSYGESANSDQFISGFFGYLPAYTSGTYAGQTSILPTIAGNPDLTWERIKDWNAGIDFGFFSSRVNGNLDVYHRTTDGNIIPQQLSLTSGYANESVNAGTVVNKGIELALNIDLVSLRDLKWTIGGNLSYNHNEVTGLGQGTPFQFGSSLVKVGLPLGSYYMVKWAGVDAATGQPLYYDKTGKVTNIYSSDNSVTGFGTYNAPWIGGFNTGLSYKGFSLKALFTFQEGFTLLNNQNYFLTNASFVAQGFNARTAMLSMWQNPGDVTDIQNATSQRNFSSRDIQDASYLRFRNLTLAYNIDPRLLDRAKIFSGARVFVQAENLYTWTRWIGLDPENSSNGASFNYPAPRTYTFGLNFSFN